MAYPLSFLHGIDSDALKNEGLVVSAYFSAMRVPDLPPCFSSSLTSVTVMPSPVRAQSTGFGNA